MKRDRRQLLAAAGALSFLGSGAAFSESFPSRPLRIIVPAGPGTAIDSIARHFSDPLSERFKVPVGVDNRSGAGGLLAYNALLGAQPDGHTLILSALPLFLLPALAEGKPPFDPVKDFAPISRVSRTPMVVVVASDSKFRSLDALIKATGQTNNDLTFSSAGVGSGAHICGELLQGANLVKARHIAYKDSAAAIVDVAAGRITFTCQGTSGVRALIEAGKLRPLAVTSPTRLESLAEVPTTAQAGYPGAEFWAGNEFMGPAGLPARVLQTLSDAVMKIAEAPQFKAFCAKQDHIRDLADNSAMRELVPKEAIAYRKMVALARKY